MESTANTPRPTMMYRADHVNYVFHIAFTACMDTEYNIPRWVSHHISDTALRKVYNTRPSSYYKDDQYPTIPRKAYGASGYDHGHIAPAADFQWERNAYLQSFFMTNMAPQHGCLNQRGWCQLEGTVRKWAEEGLAKDIYIVSGPVLDEFTDTLCLTDGTRIFVPAQFFKVVLLTDSCAPPRAIGYLLPNADVDFNNLRQYEVTVDEVESLTGLDFFSFVPHTQQQAAESIKANITYYDTEKFCPNKDCAGVYNGRIRPESRIRLNCE